MAVYKVEISLTLDVPDVEMDAVQANAHDIISRVTENIPQENIEGRGVFDTAQQAADLTSQDPGQAVRIVVGNIVHACLMDMMPVTLGSVTVYTEPVEAESD